MQGRHLSTLWLLAMASAAFGQWSFEDVDVSIQSRATAWPGIAADGTVLMMYVGPGDGYSCGGETDVYVKVRVGPNNWFEPPAIYTPYRLRVTRPQAVFDPAGNIYIVFERFWANYTGVMKFTRTGPTTWVREGDPVYLRAPGYMPPCGQTDSNLPSTYYMYGYNPRMCVAPDGSLHAFVNRVIDGQTTCVYAYNNGANWRATWSVNYAWSSMNGYSIAADDSSQVHIALSTTNADPNLADNVYVKTYNGVAVVGPTVIGDGGARTGESSIGAGNATACLASMEWNVNGSGIWNIYQWAVNGTQISGPTQVTYQPSGAGTTAPRVIARNGWLRYIWRKDATDARWAWYMTRAGYADERISLPGHDTGDIQVVTDANGNMHAGILDWDAVRGNVYQYGYRANPDPPPSYPRGTMAGAVRDQYGMLLPNATIQCASAGTTTTGPTGAYSMLIATGTYTAACTKAFYAGQNVPGVAISENQTTSVNFTLTGQAPGPVASFSVAQGDTRNVLTWINPSSAQYSATRIMMKTTGYPTGPGDGALLVEDAGGVSATRSFTHTGLTNGQRYYYTAFTYFVDASRFYSGGVSVDGAPAVRADFDRDGDVDQSDYGIEQKCFSGAYIAQTDPACAPCKLDADEDVDADDLAVFLNCFRGPGVYATPNCAG